MKYILILLLSIFGFRLSSFAASQPNIILILADDLGGHDIGCYGSTFHQTPHLDALAKRGMRFTNAYAASPLCSPTRSSILTGLAPARTGITAPTCHLREVVLEKRLAKAGPNTKLLIAESLTRLNTEYVTAAEVLHDAGYRTGHFGKWHLGAEPTQGTAQSRPRGHYYNFGLPSQ
jgi:arylsulfatase A-like enzyme